MNFALWVNFCHIMGLIVEILLITKNECLIEVWLYSKSIIG